MREARRHGDALMPDAKTAFMRLIVTGTAKWSFSA